MKQSGKTIVMFSLFILLFFTGNVFAALKASLDQEQIPLGDSVTLSLVADKRVSGQPDTAGLENDFDVLGIASGSRINILNGSMNSETTWDITLSPKHTGTLTIPSLEVGGLRSQPIQLKVTGTAAPMAESGADIFLESELEPQQPFIRQQVLLRVRLFYDTELQEGLLDDPQIKDAVVRRLGKDHHYRINRNGRLYSVMERNYALFFQASGPHKIPGPIFSGKVVDKRNMHRQPDPFGSFFNQDPFRMLQSLRPVKLRGEEKELNILPPPAGNPERTWLPAGSVQLTEEWNPAKQEIKAGDPLTRTLTLTAHGLTGAQLPDLGGQEVLGFNVYPDKAEERTEDDPDGVVGKKVRKIAFIPAGSGKFTIPGVTLAWWNTKTNKSEHIEIPSRSVEVLQEPGQKKAEPPASQAPAAQLSATEKPSEKSVKNQPTAVAAQARPTLWMMLALLVTVAWLMTLFFWWREREKKSGKAPQTTIYEREKTHLQTSLKRLQQACQEKNPREARLALLQWGGAHWPANPPSGLEEMATRLQDASLKDALRKLDETLYQAAAIEPWDGEPLLSLLNRFSSIDPRQDQRKSSGLPPLYRSVQ
jgi:hypothetical protein